MDFRKSRILMWIGFAVGIFIMAVGIGCNNEKTIGGFMAVGTIVFFAALVQAFVFCVCPHCGYSLMNVRGGIPKHCPECGGQLNEN